MCAPTVFDRIMTDAGFMLNPASVYEKLIGGTGAEPFILQKKSGFSDPAFIIQRYFTFTAEST
jgi:hypothetical protein